MFGKLNNRAYCVGGCVRDELLGLAPKDVDFVIECTEEEFRQVFPDAPKVGESFPVFLVEGNEVALTRTERSTGPFYGDFELTGVGVPIADDLARRDFTINSIARNYATGEIVDPLNGVTDLRARIIRCLNPSAFEDDPLRIYRGLRFASRFHFTIEPSTSLMMRVSAWRLLAINRERVVLELKKMYAQSSCPSEFFETLAYDIAGLSQHFDPLTDLLDIPAGPFQYHGNNTAFQHTMEAIDRCKELDLDFDCFIACLMHDCGKGKTPLEVLPHHYKHDLRGLDVAKEWFKENRFNNSTERLSMVVIGNHMNFRDLPKMRNFKKIEFAKRIPKDLREAFVACCECDGRQEEETIVTWNNVIDVIDTTLIEVPKGCEDPKSFVVQTYAKEYSRRYMKK